MPRRCRYHSGSGQRGWLSLASFLPALAGLFAFAHPFGTLVAARDNRTEEAP